MTLIAKENNKKRFQSFSALKPFIYNLTTFYSNSENY